MDADAPDDHIVYSLDLAPFNASIDPLTGGIAWAPSENDGPGNFEFVVRATDEAGSLIQNRSS